ncbi:MAG TPA: Ig-like domain-containing protein [Actinomycetota bacterium]|nr:Ig-like domain-containing protein [Actinomycetota bacterium]
MTASVHAPIARAEAGGLLPPVRLGIPGVSSLVSDGTILYAVGAVANEVWMSRSSDGGNTWEPPRTVYEAPEGHHVRVRSDAHGGTVALAVVGGPYLDGYGGVLDGSLRALVSDDSGGSFSTPAVLEADLGADPEWEWDVDAGAHGVAVAWVVHPRGAEVSHLYVAQASDGASFSAPAELASGPGLAAPAVVSGSSLHVLAAADGISAWSGEGDGSFTHRALGPGSLPRSRYAAVDGATDTLHLFANRDGATLISAAPDGSSGSVAVPGDPWLGSVGAADGVVAVAGGGRFVRSGDGGTTFGLPIEIAGGAAHVAVHAGRPVVATDTRSDGSVIQVWDAGVTRSAPDTLLTSKPPVRTSQTTAGFSFSSDDPDASFECSTAFDGPYLPCTSPVALSDLGDGHHYFSVRAASPDGHWDPSPAWWWWQVDGQIAEVSITAAPSGVTTDDEATIEFQASRGVRSLECSLNGQPLHVCTSPVHLTDLAPGPYRFSVLGRGANGETSSDTATWEVAVVPEIRIVDRPDPYVGSPDALIYFEVNDTSAALTCSLDGAAYPADGSACASPVQLSGLGDGEHAFSVRAVNAVGEAVERVDWTVESPPDTEILWGPPPHTSSPSASFGLASTRMDSSFRCGLDGEPLKTCSELVELEDLEEGPHQLVVAASSPHGFVDPTPAGWTWTVDQTPPEVEITSPRPGSIRPGPRGRGRRRGRAVVASGRELQLRADVSDGNGVAWVAFSVDGRPVCHVETGPYACDVTVRRGRHVVEVEAVDPAGNATIENVIVWVL